MPNGKGSWIPVVIDKKDIQMLIRQRSKVTVPLKDIYVMSPYGRANPVDVEVKCSSHGTARRVVNAMNMKRRTLWTQQYGRESRHKYWVNLVDTDRGRWVEVMNGKMAGSLKNALSGLKAYGITAAQFRNVRMRGNKGTNGADSVLVECASSKEADKMVRDLNAQYQRDTEVVGHGEMSMEELKSAVQRADELRTRTLARIYKQRYIDRNVSAEGKEKTVALHNVHYTLTVGDVEEMCARFGRVDVCAESKLSWGLYGVTMEEPGVSKLISVRLN